MQTKILRLFGKNSILEKETILEMHSLHLRNDTVDFGIEEEQEENRWKEDPLTGHLSVVDAAISTLPCHLIDKHWQWVTTLDLSRNHIG